MHDASIRQRITTKYTELAPLMDERLRRRWAASEAIAIGWGGVQLLAAITGLSPTTIRKGRAELARLDEGLYPKGIEVSDEELETVRLKPDSFHGDWNYTITPGRTRK
jgi:hypothetical protein